MKALFVISFAIVLFIVPSVNAQQIDTVTLRYVASEPVTFADGETRQLEFPRRMWNSHNDSVVNDVPPGTGWRFVAPVAGIYQVQVHFEPRGFQRLECYAVLTLHSSSAGQVDAERDSGNFAEVSIVRDVHLAKGEQLWTMYGHACGQAAILGSASFAAHLVRACNPPSVCK